MKVGFKGVNILWTCYPGVTFQKSQRPSTAKYTWDIHGRRHHAVKVGLNDLFHVAFMRKTDLELHYVKDLCAVTVYTCLKIYLYKKHCLLLSTMLHSLACFIVWLLNMLHIHGFVYTWLWNEWSAQSKWVIFQLLPGWNRWTHFS